MSHVSSKRSALPLPSWSMRSPAKLNLFLEVLGRREDGFHQIETVMAPVSLADVITVFPNEQGSIELVVQGPQSEGVPRDERNLVIQAARLLSRELGDRHCDLGATIHLEKHIPNEAGMGGASSNAAVTLRMLNWIWDADLDLSVLYRMAAELGSDVPYFLQSHWAVATGRGEVITPINGPAAIPVVIAKPSVGLKTADVYRQHRPPDNPQNLNLFLEAVRHGRFSDMGDRLFNRLQAPAMALAPELTKIQAAYEKLPTLGHQLTGSGTAYFGLFGNRKVANWAAACLSNRFPDATICSGCIGSAGGKLC